MPECEKLQYILTKNYIENGDYRPYERVIYYWEYEGEILWGYSAEIMRSVMGKVLLLGE